MKKERNRNDEKNYRKSAIRKLICQERGITLVALVITIIIIIILATVTINMVFNGGIIDKAQLAADMYADDTAYTDESMANATAYLNEMLSEAEGAKVPSDWNLDKVTPVLSEDDIYVPVPKGFTASTIDGEKSVNDGFVIKQGNNGAATSGVNEFVWIPVDSLDEMYNTDQPNIELSKSTLNEDSTTTNIYSSLRGVNDNAPGTGNGYREPDILPDSDNGDAIISTSDKGIEKIKSVLGISGSTDAEVLKNYAQSLVDEYQAIYNSIVKYGGFYIGRYELTGTTSSPAVQKGEQVLVDQEWYSLKKACTDLVNTDYAKSGMLYGNQWDEVMDWLINTNEKTEDDIDVDSSSWGNYADYNTTNGYTEGDEEYIAEAGTKVMTAGFSKYWKANNIYDLAGNAREWTQEAGHRYNRIMRGGTHDQTGSERMASHRSGIYPWEVSSRTSSRPVLYINAM